jgi:hypothetical protein
MLEGAICASIASSHRSLEFEQGRQRLTIDTTLLHRKCAGQKFLKAFSIEVGVGTHDITP